MKPILKAISIALALSFVLVLLPVSALCASSPSPGIGDFFKTTPTPTPTPGDKTVPGGGKRPDGEPPGDGDGPGSGSGEGEQQKPPLTPPIPPGKKPPTEPPIEIEIPEDGNDADIKPKKGKKKEYEKQAVWTISFKKAQSSAPNKHLPEGFYENYTLDYTATKQSGDTMLGNYTGSGHLLLIIDASGLIGMSQGILQQMDMAWEGPLSGIAFELIGSYAENQYDNLTPLAPEDLAPLGPEDSQKPKLSGEANSAMTWEAAMIENYFQFPEIAGPMIEANPPSNLTYFIYAYPSGRAEISLYGTTAAKAYLTFWGSISKKIDWKQVS